MYRTFLVPLDGSELAERAIPHAVRFAQASGGRLVLVRVALAPRDDPFPAWAERLDDELDLAGTAFDPVEGVRPTKKWVERQARTHVNELPGTCLRRDRGRRDPDDRPELTDLDRGQEVALFDEHFGTQVSQTK